MISALLVVGARCLSPFEVGKDQALQLEAALRLVDGKGLTCTYDTALPPYDFSQKPSAHVLTWWPPIFSLLVAGLLKLGIPLATSLKLIYATITVIGWGGWGVIATVFFAAPIRIGEKRLSLGFLIAALAPVFFTLSWGGTDIILWGGIPYIVLLLYKSGRGSHQYLSLAMAGTLFGILYGVRYASSFLAFASVAMLFFTNIPDYKTFSKKAALFLGFGLLTALPVVLFVRIFSEQGGPLPDYVDASYGITRLGETLHRIFNFLPVISNSAFCMPLFEELILNRINFRTLNYGFGLFSLGVLLLLPIISIKMRKDAEKKGLWEIPLALSLLPISLIALLVAMVFITDQLMIEVSRYHEPIRLYCIMLYYGLATAMATPRIVRHASMAMLFIFLSFLCIYLPLRAMTPVKQDDIVRFVLGFTPSNSRLHTSTSQRLDFPSNQIYSLKEGSREKIRELHEAYPQAIFFANGYPFYVYDDCMLGEPCPGIELRKLPDKQYWQKAYTSQPLKVFWVLNRPGDLPESLPESNRKLISTDQFEKTYIFESDFPAGYKFANDL